MRGLEDQEPEKDSSQPEQPAGSPNLGEPAGFLVIGQLRRPHGVEGEVIFDIITDFPERLQPGVTVYVGRDYRPLTIKRRRVHTNSLILKFTEFDTPEAVGELRNQMVFVRSEDRPPLPEGEYYHHQLIGLQVIDDDTNQPLGALAQILDNTGANDVYVVRPAQGPDILLPAIDEVIRDINLERGEIRVHLLPGLLPD